MLFTDPPPRHVYYGFTCGETIQTPDGPARVVHPGDRGIPRRVYVRFAEAGNRSAYTAHYAIEELSR